MDTIHDARDNFMKIVMRNNNYYAQFIRDFSMNQLLKNVQPEDIEDISERFIPLVTDGQDADTVKQIRLSGTEEPVFIISLTEHQSSVRFDIAIKLLQYMVYIWIDYCRRNDKKCDENKKNGIEDPRLVRSSAKGFKLPPILPIVYYDGEHTWTADKNFAERVFPRAGFEEYIPQFSYVLVDLNQYSREELQSNQNLMSLVMILDKIKKPEDVIGLKQYAEPCLEAAEQSDVDILRQVTVLIMNKAGVDQSVIKKTVELYEGRPTQMFEVLERNMKIIRAEERQAGHQAGRQEVWEEKERERQEKERERQEKERERQEKEKAWQEKERAIANLHNIAKYFLAQGKSLEETATITGLRMEEVAALQSEVASPPS